MLFHRRSERQLLLNWSGVPTVLEHFSRVVLHPLGFRLVVHANEVSDIETGDAVLRYLNHIGESSCLDAFQFRFREECLRLVLEVLVDTVDQKDIICKVADFRGSGNVLKAKKRSLFAWTISSSSSRLTGEKRGSSKAAARAISATISCSGMSSPKCPMQPRR